MEFPKKSSTRGCKKGLSTQKCECQSCAGSNKEICGLCGKQVPSVSLSDEMVIDNPPDTCQCFLSYSSEIGAEEEASFKNEQKTELPTLQIPGPQNLNLLNPTKEISDARGDSSNISMTSEESKTPEFSNSSTGYAVSPGDLSDRSFTSNTRNTTPSSEEDAKMNLNEIGSQNLGHNENESNSKPRTTKDEHADNQKARGAGSSNFEYAMSLGSSKSAQNENVSMGPDKSRSRNLNIRFQTIRPRFPRPFYRPYQPYINPAHRPFSQMYQPYVIPIMPAPVIPTSAVGRFPVLPYQRPHIPEYRQQPNAEEGARQSNDEKEQLQSQLERMSRIERVRNWLNNVENVPPTEESSSNDVVPIGAENEQFFPTVSTDERSSTEISEEENRRQRSSRRPPRFSKRNRRK